MLYAGALAVRSAVRLGARPKAQFGIDAVVRFLMRGVWALLVLALPLAAYYVQLKGLVPHGGFPHLSH